MILTIRIYKEETPSDDKSMQAIKLLQTGEGKSLLILAEELLRRTNNNVSSQFSTTSTSTPSSTSNNNPSNNVQEPALNLNLDSNDQFKILKEQQRVIADNYEQSNNLQVLIHFLFFHFLFILFHFDLFLVCQTCY